MRQTLIFTLQDVTIEIYMTFNKLTVLFQEGCEEE